MRRNVVLTILYTQKIYHHAWKTVITTLKYIVGLQLRGEGHVMEKNCGTNLSHSFPRMVTYILCVENCQSYILTHSSLPIAGRLFYNVRKFHGPRI